MGDPEVRLRSGAAVAPAMGGGFVIVGGLERPRVPGDDQTNDAVTRIVYVPADGSVSTIWDLSVPRAYATATRAGEYIVVAGGVQRDDGLAEGTFEVLDARTGEPLGRAEPMCVGDCDRRRDHGAAALSDGRVLVVGGVEQVTWETPGDPRSAELVTRRHASMIAIDPATSEVEAYSDLLTPDGEAAPRRFPQVLALDDGAIVIVDGEDLETDGADMFHVAAGSSTPVPVFVLPSGVPPEWRDGAISVALPGARVGRLGGAGSASDPLVTVLLFEDAPDAAVRKDVGFGAIRANYEDAVATVLEDGRIVAAGRGGQAALFDVGRQVAIPLTLGRAATVLQRLDDGTIAELDRDEGYLRRQLSPPHTRWDSPPGTLTLDDDAWLAISVVDHIDLATGSAMVGETVRVDVAGVVFGDVAITPIASGTVHVLFQEEIGPFPTRVIVGPDVVSTGLCEMDEACEVPVRVERRGADIALMCAQPVAQQVCRGALADPTAGMRVALRLFDDSRFSGVTIERL
jgi:hypothetical protein